MMFIDLDFNKDGTPRTKEDLLRLLDCAKRNDAKLPKDEQGRLIDEINYKLNGKRFEHKEILKDIEASSADISDIGV